MSAAARHRLLLRAFPRVWRERYGDELDALIVQSEAGPSNRLRTTLDVLRAGLAERLGASGLTGDRRPAPERVRARVLVVLCAWSLFVVAGVAVQKASEHWQGSTPRADLQVPSAAFLTLELLAVAGSALVLVGIAPVLPALLIRVRAGEAGALRRPLLRAVISSLVALCALIGLVLWARGLTPAERNGHDVAYEAAVVVSAVLGICALASWTVAAVVAATLVPLRGSLLELEVGIAASLTAAMAVMAAATIVWWLSLASSSASFVGAGPAVGSAVMLIAVGTAATGTAGALRARSDLQRPV